MKKLLKNEWFYRVLGAIVVLIGIFSEHRSLYMVGWAVYFVALFTADWFRVKQRLEGNSADFIAVYQRHYLICSALLWLGVIAVVSGFFGGTTDLMKLCLIGLGILLLLAGWLLNRKWQVLNNRP